MLFSEWVLLPDLSKLYTTEIKAGIEFDRPGWTAAAWTSDGAGAYYKSAWDTTGGLNYGEIVSVYENGVAYTKAATKAACDSTASSFYVDYSTWVIYVHASGGDSPATLVAGEKKYVIIAYVWLCITNQQFEDAPVVFVPQDATGAVWYLPYMNVSSLPSITQSVGDYYSGSVQIQFGDLQFVNDGWWYPVLKNLYLHNSEVYVKIGAKGSTYAELETIFIGRVRDQNVSDSGATLAVSDSRIGQFHEIPLHKFELATYPNLEANADGRVIPILFGEVTGITPTKIDNWIYKVSDTVLGMEAITAVYKDGVIMTLTTDYTVNLAAGTFTLLVDPSNSLITCDAKGEKCDVNWTATPPDYTTPRAYSENVADILYFVLVQMNGIPAAKIDKTSFADLNASRTYKLAWLLDTVTATLDFVRLLQATAIFHHLPMLSGSHGAFRYTTDLTGATYLWKEDFGALSITHQSDSTFSEVIVKYKKNPSTNSWLAVSSVSSPSVYRYGEPRTLTIETALRDVTDAQNVLDFYLAIVANPAKKVTGDGPARLLNLNPTARIIISKDIVDGQGAALTVFEQEAFRLMSLQKDLATARVTFIGIDMLQAAGDLICTTCYGCQDCIAAQGGTCSLCFSCQECNSGQCAACQSCYGCEFCNVAQCAGCQMCYNCEHCNASCQASEGTCRTCQHCVSCYSCVTSQAAPSCPTCQSCVACQNHY